MTDLQQRDGRRILTAKRVQAPTPFPMGAPRGAGAVWCPAQGLAPVLVATAFRSHARAGDAVQRCLTHLSVRGALLVSPMKVPSVCQPWDRTPPEPPGLPSLTRPPQSGTPCLSAMQAPRTSRAPLRPETALLPVPGLSPALCPDKEIANPGGAPGRGPETDPRGGEQPPGAPVQLCTLHA